VNHHTWQRGLHVNGSGALSFESKLPKMLSTEGTVYIFLFLVFTGRKKRHWFEPVQSSNYIVKKRKLEWNNIGS
jgi:hypothetical protein